MEWSEIEERTETQRFIYLLRVLYHFLVKQTTTKTPTNFKLINLDSYLIFRRNRNIKATQKHIDVVEGRNKKIWTQISYRIEITLNKNF